MSCSTAGQLTQQGLLHRCNASTAAAASPGDGQALEAHVSLGVAPLPGRVGEGNKVRKAGTLSHKRGLLASGTAARSGSKRDQRWPLPTPLQPQCRSQLALVHSQLQGQKGVGNVSAHTLRKAALHPTPGRCRMSAQTESKGSLTSGRPFTVALGRTLRLGKRPNRPLNASCGQAHGLKVWGRHCTLRPRGTQLQHPNNQQRPGGSAPDMSASRSAA